MAMKPSEKLMNAITQYQAGHQEAFEIIYDESLGYVTQSVLNVLNKTVGNPSDFLRQDIIQETYLTIATKLSELRNPDAFLQWAGRIATHHAERTWQRDAAHTPIDLAQEDLDQEPAPSEFIPEDILENQETLRIIRQLLQELPVNQYLCIVEYYYNGLKEAEVAQKLGMPLNTVKTNLSRAKKKLRLVIEDTEKKEDIRLHSVAWLLLALYHREIRELVVSEVEKLDLWGLIQPQLPAGTTASGTVAASAASVKAGSGGFFGSLAVKIGAVAIAAAVAVGGIYSICRKPLEDDPPAVSITEPMPSTEATEEVTTPPTEPVAGIHLSPEELNQLAAAINHLAVYNQGETYVHWINEPSQQTYDITYQTLSNAVNESMGYPLNVSDWQGDYSVSVADAATFLGGIFGNVPGDLSTYCDGAFVFNDGTTMGHMFLPGDVYTFTNILAVEQIEDSQNIRIFAAEYSGDSMGNCELFQYDAVYAYRNPNSYMGWTFSEVFCFTDPAYLPEISGGDLSQGLDCVPDSGFSEEIFHGGVNTEKTSDGYLTEAAAARFAEAYWEVEPGEYYGENRRSEESVIYLYSEDIDENDIPYYEFRWCYEDGGYMHTVDFVKISKIDGQVLNPYMEPTPEPGVEDATLPTMPEETPSESVQYNGKTVAVSRISQKTTYDYDGSVMFCTDYIYNQNGQIQESITRDSDGSISSRSKYDYDSKGHLIREVDANERGSVRWIEYTYDPDSGLLVKEQFCDENGNHLNEKTTYSYTYEGKLQTKCVYNNEGKLYASDNYTYDEQGNMTYCNYYFGDNFRSETCVYDQQNRLVTKTICRHSYDVLFNNVGTVISTTEYTYLSDGRLHTEITYDEYGAIVESYSWTYNKNGSSCEVGGDMGTGTITYDQHGNILTEVIYDGMVGSELGYSYIYVTMQVPEEFSD